MKDITKSELERLYLVEGKPMHVIAKETGLAIGTIYNRIHSFGIPAKKRNDYPVEECVHHINFNRSDNRLENLKLMTISEHMSYHMKLRHAKKRGDDLSTSI